MDQGILDSNPAKLVNNWPVNTLKVWNEYEEQPVCSMCTMLKSIIDQLDDSLVAIKDYKKVLYYQC